MYFNMISNLISIMLNCNKSNWKKLKLKRMLIKKSFIKIIKRSLHTINNMKNTFTFNPESLHHYMFTKKHMMKLYIDDQLKPIKTK